MTAECKPVDEVFVDESSNPCAREHLTHVNMIVVFFLSWHILLLATCFSAGAGLYC